MTQELENRIEALEKQVEDLNSFMGLAAHNASIATAVIVSLTELISINDENRRLDNQLRKMEIEGLRKKIKESEE